MTDFDKRALFLAITVFAAVCASSILSFFQGLQAGMIGALIVIAMAVTFRYPRLGLWLFLIYLPFSGTVTYSFVSIYRAVGGRISYAQTYSLFHLAKDAFYLPALIMIVSFSQVFAKLRSRIKPLLIALLLLFVTCLLTFFWVNLPQQLHSETSGSPILMGLIGLKTLLGYIPLILCGYYLVGDRHSLFFLTRLQVVLILICCSLCFIQYLLLVNGTCTGNVDLVEPANYKASLQASCFVGGSLLYNPDLGLLRLPGTFVSPWQWGWFLISGSFLIYAALVGDPSRLWRVISLLAGAVILATTVISGQRIALLLVPIIFLLLLLFNTQRKRSLLLKLGILSIVSVLVFSQLDFVQQQIQSLVGRWTYAPPIKFMLKQIDWAIANYLDWLGNGLGRATSAARNYGDIRLIETFHAKLLYEIGILGTVAFLVVVTILTWLTFKAYRSIHNSSLRRLGFCLWAYILLISYNPYYYPLTVDPVAIYYWFFAGVLLKLPELESQKPFQSGSNKFAHKLKNFPPIQ